jgi:NADH dehydrogenase [ubiquinone] 1 alpha subcomplex assembly factor 7
LERVPHATWHSSVASLPGLPTILLANEFFDALPIRQFERKNGRMFERRIGIQGDRFSIGLVPTAFQSPLPGDGIFEDSTVRDAVATAVGNHLVTVGGAALIVDYGHFRSAIGDTLQAMRDHEFCAVTENVGDADLTSHVDFENLGRGFAQSGVKISGVMSQGQFLQAMGLEARTQALVAGKTTEKRQDIVSASERLANPAQMGELFKVMAVTSGLQRAPYPFGGS